MNTKIELYAFTVVYTLAIIVLALDMFYWRPF